MTITIHLTGLDPAGRIIANIYDASDLEFLASQERHGTNGTIEIDTDDATPTLHQLHQLLDAIDRHGARATAIGPTNLVTQTEIAAAIGRSPQSVQQLATGARGPGDFPAPTNPGARHPLYQWPTVRRWLTTAGIEIIDDIDRSAIDRLNSSLQAAAH